MVLMARDADVFGQQILKKLGIEGNYEGIGHCALGYAAEPAKDAAPRKDDYKTFSKTN